MRLCDYLKKYCSRPLTKKELEATCAYHNEKIEYMRQGRLEEWYDKHEEWLKSKGIETDYEL